MAPNERTQDTIVPGPWGPPIPPESPGGGGDGDGSVRDVTLLKERLAKLEGAFDWMKVTLAILAAVLIGGFTFLGVQLGRTDAKVSDLSRDVAGLPGRISGDLRDLTKTLADTITAARHQQPQIIVLPTLPLPAANPETDKKN